MPRLLHATRSNDYLLPGLISIALHGVVVLCVSWGWDSEPAPRQVTPRYVEAKLVALQPEAIKPQPAAKPKPQVIDLTARRRAEEAARQAAEKKRLAAEKAERERLRKLAEEKAKKQRAEEAQRQREQAERERLERERQAREAREREQQRQQQAIADALAEEQALLEAQESAATAQSYVAAMAERIEHNWSRPPSARRGMQVELQLQLVPTGDVVSVTVMKSSGNSAFDRSAEQAVHKVGRFEVLRDMPPEMFERYFRQVTLVFNPRDLRL